MKKQDLQNGNWEINLFGGLIKTNIKIMKKRNNIKKYKLTYDDEIYIEKLINKVIHCHKINKSKKRNK